MRAVRAGVWHWEARQPEWNERQWWGPLVSSYAIDDGVRLLLFDPLAPPAEIEKLAEERETAIALREGDRLPVGVEAKRGTPAIERS